jgi:hypothetical protein
MTTPLELDPATHRRITQIGKEADRLREAGDFANSYDKYVEAWELLPEPKGEWEAATWLLGSMGDLCVVGGKWDAARQALEQAMHCPGGLGNPFLHLRLGQVRFEMGDMDRAADELTRAYMGAGEEIFAAEDPKYFKFLGTRIDLP